LIVENWYAVQVCDATMFSSGTKAGIKKLSFVFSLLGDKSLKYCIRRPVHWMQ
jgi:hypothetical protein